MTDWLIHDIKAIQRRAQRDNEKLVARWAHQAIERRKKEMSRIADAINEQKSQISALQAGNTALQNSNTALQKQLDAANQQILTLQGEVPDVADIAAVDSVLGPPATIVAPGTANASAGAPA